jgi:translation initiation factor IF-2
MKKVTLSGLLIIICLAFTACGSSNSFELKVTDVRFTNSEGAFAIGKVAKGTLKDGEVITIKRDGKTIKSVKVNGLINEDESGDAKSVSEGQSVYIGLGDINEDNISINDMIVK